MRGVAPSSVLVVGATGRIGRLVVAEALRHGLRVRALVRDEVRARRLLPGAELVEGDLTVAGDLAGALVGVQGVVFTHGSTDFGDERAFADVDYGTVARVLTALDGRRMRIILMTCSNVTSPAGPYREVFEWKLRSERLLRGSGQPYTIVRPGWFVPAEPGGQGVRLTQGDDHPDGEVDPGLVAEVLVAALASPASVFRTFKVFSAPGPTGSAWDLRFAELDADRSGVLHGAHDRREGISGDPR